MLNVSNVSLQYGSRVLFKEVNLSFKRGNCYGDTHTLPEEGSFFQTENTYQAFVYYKATAARAWRLVGYQEVTYK